MHPISNLNLIVWNLSFKFVCDAHTTCVQTYTLLHTHMLTHLRAHTRTNIHTCMPTNVYAHMDTHLSNAQATQKPSAINELNSAICMSGTFHVKTHDDMQAQSHRYLALNHHSCSCVPAQPSQVDKRNLFPGVRIGFGLFVLVKAFEAATATDEKH